MAFTASNGFKIAPRMFGLSAADISWSYYGEDGEFGGKFGDRVADALREYFQHERDEQLGRWRWPDSPGFVVYPWVADPSRRNVRGVTVLSEGVPRGYTVWEDNVDTLYGTSADEETRQRARDAARAYFEAHPEPKPWHDAKPGEAWVVKFATGPTFDEVALLVEDFRDEGRVFADAAEKVTLPLKDAQIIDARRIYPEEEQP